MSGEQQGVSEEDFEAARELLSEKFFTSVERFTCHCVLRVEPLNESIDFAKKAVIDLFDHVKGFYILHVTSTAILVHIPVTT